MFQKSFALASENKVSGKDRKKIRASLQRLYPRLSDEQLESVFPLKTGDCTVAKIKAPHRGQLYLLDGLPLILDLSGKGDLLPTLPVMWKISDLLPKIFTKHEAVSTFVLGGADFMLPGAMMPFEEGFLRGTLVSLSVPGNPCPFAIGRAAMSAIEATRNLQGKGKLIEIIQSYGDLMTTHFQMEPPNDGFTRTEITATEDVQYEAINPEDNLEDANEQEEGESEMSEPEDPPVKEDPPDMDMLLQQCFFQALRKSVKDKDLPLPAGELWIKHMQPHKSNTQTARECELSVSRQPGVNVDVKLSSYKKLSRFLQLFAKGADPLLTLKIEKFSNETVITAINRDHEAYTNFRPYITEQHTSPDLETADQQLKIEEVYRTGRELSQVLMSLGLEANCVLTKTEAAELPFRYVHHANLAQDVPDKHHIVLDRVLGDALFKGLLKKNEKMPDYLPKAQLREAMMQRMHRQYRISRGAQKVALFLDFTRLGHSVQVLKKGTLRCVQISQEKRTGNKFVTRVGGLETFLVEVSDLSSVLQKTFACSSSLHDAFHKGVKEQEIIIQGRRGKEIATLLKDNYGIPERFIKL